MESLPACPKCSSEFTYADGALLICPECAHEFTASESDQGEPASPAAKIYKDAHGNILQDGDSVTVIKDLKVKGSSSVVKVGTKVRGIRLVDGQDGHDISCKIEGFGSMNLKSEFVKKA